MAAVAARDVLEVTDEESEENADTVDRAAMKALEVKMSELSFMAANGPNFR